MIKALIFGLIGLHYFVLSFIDCYSLLFSSSGCSGFNLLFVFLYEGYYSFDLRPFFFSKYLKLKNVYLNTDLANPTNFDIFCVYFYSVEVFKTKFNISIYNAFKGITGNSLG